MAPLAIAELSLCGLISRLKEVLTALDPSMLFVSVTTQTHLE